MQSPECSGLSKGRWPTKNLMNFNDIMTIQVVQVVQMIPRGMKVSTNTA
jgi:hypothetical protein